MPITTREAQLIAALRYLCTRIQECQGAYCSVLCPRYTGPDQRGSVDYCAGGPRMQCRQVLYDDALRAVGGLDAEGKGGLAAIVGKWPGDETDEEIAEELAALRGGE